MMSPIRQKLNQYAQRKWLNIYSPLATLPSHSVDCPECGLRVHLPKLRQGQEASCPRCHHDLVRVENRPFQTPLACAIASLILMLLVYSQTFAEVIIGGIYTRLALPEMIYFMMVRDFSFLGTVLFVLTFGTPVLFLISCIYVYASLLNDKPFPYLLSMTRLMTRLKQWIMVDVFFISALVADIKMSSVSQVYFGTAFWLMPILAILVLRTAQSVPVHWLYYQIHKSENKPIFRPKSLEPELENEHVCCTRCLYFQPKKERFCGVCGSQLFDRRPHSLKISLAFLITAAILYLPANFLPIMITANPLEEEISTIMSGIILMWKDGDRFIASIIFSASILVPSLKIVSMAILILSAYYKPLMSIEKLSLQYRLTEMVGRWSMIDIFVIIILMNAFPTPVAYVTAGAAAFYFCVVVILTMISAHYFDVRLIWDWKTQHHSKK